MIKNCKISSIILAGGASRRMRQDKRFILLAGKTLTSYSIDLAKQYSNELIISANDRLPNFSSYKIIPDIVKGAGPVNAIGSCLMEIQNKFALVLTCDMPFITNEIINLLIKSSKANTITHFSDTKNFFPFPSVFPVSLLPRIKEFSETGNNSMKSLIALLPANEIAIPKNTSPYAFLNINRQDEYEKAKKAFPFLPDIQHTL